METKQQGQTQKKTVTAERTRSWWTRHGRLTGAEGQGAADVRIPIPPGADPVYARDSGPELRFFASTADSLPRYLAEADLVVGAVPLHAAQAPHVVTEAMVQRMQPGSVIVDVSIDQGGRMATSRPTSHAAPVFEKHGVIHDCVPNMPGAYPLASTLVLTTATLPYVLKLAHTVSTPCV